MTASAGLRLAALAGAAALCALGARQRTATIDGATRSWLYEDPMVALRYAANLVESGDLAWNPGDRVAGPARAGWTAVLAMAHLVFGLRAPAAIDALNAALLIAVLLQAERLLRDLSARPGPGAVALWIAAVACFDLVFWAVNGFEITLLTAAWLLAARRVLRERGDLRPATLALLALVPVLRAEGIAGWAGLAALALGVGGVSRRRLGLLAVSLVPLAAEAAFHRAWWGEWWPGSPIVSVVAVPSGIGLAGRYLARFSAFYGAALVLAAAGAILARDRRRALLLGAVACGGAWTALAPGPALPGVAPLAYLVPVVLTLAAAAAGDLGRRFGRAAGLLAAAALAVPAMVAAVRIPPQRLAASEPAGTVAGTLVARHAGAGATIGVFAPGSLAYFSGRRCIDLLGGLTPGGLGARPDIVVVHLPPDEVAARAAGRAGGDRMDAVLDTDLFRAEYLPHALPVLDRTTLFFRRDSPDRGRLAEWRAPEVRR